MPYDPNQTPNPGHWKGVQYIDVYDTVAPILNIPPDVTIGADQNGCYGMLDIGDMTADDCDPGVQITNNSAHAWNNGASIDGNYPVGTTNVMIMAMDGCGNMSMGSINITVIDNKPPLAVCGNGITIGLNMTGTATLPLNLIEKGSFDNCTAYEDLTFDVAPYEFSCDSLGAHEVTMTVTDANGNANSCKTIIIVQDNLGICATNKSTISGTLTTPDGDPMASTPVWLNGLDSVSTGADGSYAFIDLDQGMHYTVAPELDGNVTNGLSIGDIILIQKHLTNKQPLSDPYQLVAGDVNDSGSISIGDVIEIRKALLGLSTSFSGKPSWIFIPADYDFTNPYAPTQEDYPENFLIEDILGIHEGKDFIAIKLGDVNYTAKASGLLESEVRTGALVSLVTEDIDLQPGYTYQVPVRVEGPEALLGIQSQLVLDPAVGQITGYQPGGCATLHPEMIRIVDAGARMVWHTLQPDPQLNESALVILEITATGAGRLSEALSLADDLPAEAINTWNEAADIDLRFTNPWSWSGQVLDAPVPNPFSTETRIGFQMPQAGSVLLRIFNSAGQEVWRQAGEYSQGAHHLMVQASELGRSGLYQIRIDTPYTRSVSQSLVLIDE